MTHPIKKPVLPPVDPLYWAMMLGATALGEKLGDLVSMTFGLDYGPSSALLVAAALAAILIQLAAPRRSVPLYWAVVVLTSTASTTMSDFMTRAVGLGYGYGSLLLIGLLAAIAAVWHRVAPGAAPAAAMSRPVEVLYWLAMLVAGTLGTASGDFVANGTLLGFGGGAVLLAGLLGVLAAIAAGTTLRKPWLYWAAVLVANPLGATLGDYLDKPDGLDLGVVTSVLILSCVFAVIVVFSMRRPLPSDLAGIETVP